MSTVEIRKGFEPETFPEAPYSVTILWDCSFDDPMQGMSDVSWFATEAEQEAYFEKVSVEHHKALPKKVYINKSTNSAYWLEGDMLAFAPFMQDGTFSFEDSGIVEENNTDLAEEHIHEPETENFETLGDVWAKARIALS